MPTYDVNTIPVEIFATGDWAGLTWTEKELDEMVQNFSDLKDYIKPPVKLGHNSQQILGGQSDGQPALGWISGLKRVGQKLIADVRDVPKILRELVDKGAYSRVSAEIYPHFEKTVAARNIGKSVNGCVLSALAFVGADVPEVKTLEDLGRVLAIEGLRFAEPTAGIVTCTLNAGREDGIEGTPALLSNVENPPKVVVVAQESQDSKVSNDDHNGEGTMLENQNTQATQVDEMQIKFTEMQSQMSDLQTALKAQNDTIAKQNETITAQSATVEVLQTAKQMSEGEITKLTEEVTRSKQREAQAEAARLASEALHFVEDRSTRANMKLMPSQREYARRLYAVLGDDVELITATEGSELKLFGEKERPASLSPRECLKRLIDSWPGADKLGEELSLYTEPKEESFNEALDSLMFTEKMDPASHVDRSKAVRLLIARNPSFLPTYGGNSR